MSYTLTADQLRQFKLLFGRRTNRELAKHFGVTLAEVEETGRRFALGKDKRTFKGGRMPRWSDAELERLRELYPTTPNLDIARAIGRSVKSIVSKAHQLELKKSVERLREMGAQNVALREDRKA